MIQELIKIANELDSRGLSKEADFLDIIISKRANSMAAALKNLKMISQRIQVEEETEEELEQDLDDLFYDLEDLEKGCEDGDDEACEEAEEVLDDIDIVEEKLEARFPSYDPRLDSAELISKTLSNAPGERDTAYYKYVDPETGEVEYFEIDIEDEE